MGGHDRDSEDHEKIQRCGYQRSQPHLEHRPHRNARAGKPDQPREAEKPEERVALTVHEAVTATFALRYLVTFAKAAPLSSTVELGLGPDSPLSVKYELDNADNGYMQFYLAPKIDDWNRSMTSGMEASRVGYH